MALSPGTRIGPYEVTAPIGAGGMGEVYRATDTNLKRTVAIKVLPESLASNTDRLARFRREAEVLASPDGRWLAYGSNATGAREIWVRPYPRGGSPVRVSANGGIEPIWSNDGRELIYLQGDDVMSMAVHDASSTFRFSPALRLFAMRTPLKTQPPSYDVAADGSLLMLKPIPNVHAPLEVVLDWRGMIGRPAAVTTDH